VSFRLYEYDFWEHLAFGRAIWQSGGVPRLQVWTWPDLGAPLVNPSWGFSALLWPFWAAGGEWGLAAWRWLTTALVFVLAWRTARAFGVRAIPTLLVFVVCGLVYRQRSQVRPETLAAVLLALEVWLLEARRPGRTRDLALAGTLWLWANVHVSWLFGLVLVVIRWLDAALRPAADRPASARGLGRVLVAAAALAFVNPYGWHAVVRPFQFQLEWRHDPLLGAISELQPLDWSVNLSNGLPLLLAGWPLLVLWRWRRGKGRAERGSGLDRVEAATCALVTALVLSGNRFTATYAIVAAPYAARALDQWILAHFRPPRRAGAWAQAIATSIAAVAIGAWEWTHFENALGVAIDPRRHPVKACDFMAREGVRGRGLNDFFLGGYMLWRFWPDPGRLPFMDIHPEDKPADVRRAYVDAWSTRRGWEAFDKRYGFDYVLLSRARLGAPALLDLLDTRPEWALVAVDDAAALYVRRTGPLRAIAEAHAYRHLPGGAAKLRQLALASTLDPALAAEVRVELARQSRDSPWGESFAVLSEASAGAAAVRSAP
jgi:hypothetical protein